MNPLCAALGCGKVCAKTAQFCRRCLSRLPADMRTGVLRAAVLYLGRLDGFLVDVPEPTTRITEV